MTEISDVKDPEVIGNDKSWMRLRIVDSAEVNGVRFPAGVVIDVKGEDGEKLIESGKADFISTEESRQFKSEEGLEEANNIVDTSENEQSNETLEQSTAEEVEAEEIPEESTAEEVEAEELPEESTAEEVEAEEIPEESAAEEVEAEEISEVKAEEIPEESTAEEVEKKRYLKRVQRKRYLKRVLRGRRRKRYRRGDRSSKKN